MYVCHVVFPIFSWGSPKSMYRKKFFSRYLSYTTSTASSSLFNHLDNNRRKLQITKTPYVIFSIPLSLLSQSPFTPHSEEQNFAHKMQLNTAATDYDAEAANSQVAMMWLPWGNANRSSATSWSSDSWISDFQPTKYIAVCIIKANLTWSETNGGRNIRCVLTLLEISTATWNAAVTRAIFQRPNVHM